MSCWGRDGNGEAQKKLLEVSVEKREESKSSLQAEGEGVELFLGSQRCLLAQELLNPAAAEHMNKHSISFPAGSRAGAKTLGCSSFPFSWHQ